MHQLSQFFESHPKKTTAENKEFLDCLEACSDCVVTCSACADACLAEEQVKDLIQCIQSNLNCADVCGAAAKLLTRQTSRGAFPEAQIRAVIEATRVCAVECERHQHMEHCRVCAEVCRACERNCDALLSGPIAAAA